MLNRTLNQLRIFVSRTGKSSFFQEWDFINVRNIGENQTLPYLRTVPAGDINKNRRINFHDIAILCKEWLTEE